MNVPSGRHQDAEGVRQFFDQWDIYKKVVSHNYLCHREAYGALNIALERFKKPFSFLDLGSGDAEWTSRILADKPVAHYEAVDLSAVALDLARKNLDGLPCSKRFSQEDFFRFVRSDSSARDVVFIGLSLHHLPLDDKKSFLSHVVRLVAENGSFFFYEPIHRFGESREEGLTRWWEHVTRTWTACTPEELARIREHCFENDYPESLEAYDSCALDAGFRATHVWYEDPGAFYAVLECRR